MQLSSVTVHHMLKNDVIAAVRELPHEFSNTGRLQAVTVETSFLLVAGCWWLSADSPSLTNDNCSSCDFLSAHFLL